MPIHLANATFAAHVAPVHEGSQPNSTWIDRDSRNVVVQDSTGALSRYPFDSVTFQPFHATLYHSVVAARTDAFIRRSYQPRSIASRNERIRGDIPSLHSFQGLDSAPPLECVLVQGSMCANTGDVFCQLVLNIMTDISKGLAIFTEGKPCMSYSIVALAPSEDCAAHDVLSSHTAHNESTSGSFPLYDSLPIIRDDCHFEKVELTDDSISCASRILRNCVSEAEDGRVVVVTLHPIDPTYRNEIIPPFRVVMLPQSGNTDVKHSERIARLQEELIDAARLWAVKAYHDTGYTAPVRDDILVPHSAPGFAIPTSLSDLIFSCAYAKTHARVSMTYLVVLTCVNSANADLASTKRSLDFVRPIASCFFSSRFPQSQGLHFDPSRFFSDGPRRRMSGILRRTPGNGVGGTTFDQSPGFPYDSSSPQSTTEAVSKDHSSFREMGRTHFSAHDSEDINYRTGYGARSDHTNTQPLRTPQTPPICSRAANNRHGVSTDNIKATIYTAPHYDAQTPVSPDQHVLSQNMKDPHFKDFVENYLRATAQEVKDKEQSYKESISVLRAKESSAKKALREMESIKASQSTVESDLREFQDRIRGYREQAALEERHTAETHLKANEASHQLQLNMVDHVLSLGQMQTQETNLRRRLREIHVEIDAATNDYNDLLSKQTSAINSIQSEHDRLSRALSQLNNQITTATNLLVHLHTDIADQTHNKDMNEKEIAATRLKLTTAREQESALEERLRAAETAARSAEEASRRRVADCKAKEDAAREQESALEERLRAAEAAARSAEEASRRRVADCKAKEDAAREQESALEERLRAAETAARSAEEASRRRVADCKAKEDAAREQESALEERLRAAETAARSAEEASRRRVADCKAKEDAAREQESALEERLRAAETAARSAEEASRRRVADCKAKEDAAREQESALEERLHAAEAAARSAEEASRRRVADCKAKEDAAREQESALEERLHAAEAAARSAEEATSANQNEIDANGISSVSHVGESMRTSISLYDELLVSNVMVAVDSVRGVEEQMLDRIAEAEELLRFGEADAVAREAAAMDRIGRMMESLYDRGSVSMSPRSASRWSERGGRSMISGVVPLYDFAVFVDDRNYLWLEYLEACEAFILDCLADCSFFEGLRSARGGEGAKTISSGYPSIDIDRSPTLSAGDGGQLSPVRRDSVDLPDEDEVEDEVALLSAGDADDVVHVEVIRLCNDLNALLSLAKSVSVSELRFFELSLLALVSVVNRCVRSRDSEAVQKEAFSRWVEYTQDSNR